MNNATAGCMGDNIGSPDRVELVDQYGEGVARTGMPRPGAVQFLIRLASHAKQMAELDDGTTKSMARCLAISRCG